MIFPGVVEDESAANGGSAREKFERLVLMVKKRDLMRLDIVVRAWALPEPAAAEQVAITDQLRLDYIQSLFRDMGFRGYQLEIRAEMALAAITMQNRRKVDARKL